VVPPMLGGRPSQCGWPIANRYFLPDHEILTAIAAFNTASREEPRSAAVV
jgi:hypothetical protein